MALRQRVRVTPEEYLENFIRDGRIVVGTFIKGKDGCFVIPDDERLPQHFDVKNVTDRGQTVMTATISGHKVVAVFEEKIKNPKSPKVNVIELLGNADKVGTDVLSIIRAHKLYEEFPGEVITEAKRVAKPASTDEIARRTDLRKSTLITIDPYDAADLDDAVSLQKQDDGSFKLGVHIADVSHYVRPKNNHTDGFLDEEAFKRGTSVYLPNAVLPMLPVELSNNICSLNPNVDRLALSVFIRIDRAGDIIDHNIVESVINIKNRFNYEEVQKILDGDAELRKQHKKLVPMLNDMAELTHLLEKVRAKRGEVVFDVPEPKIILDTETGKISDVIAYPRYLSHRMIESFMVICNEVIARFAKEHSLPFVYRIHEKPDPMKVAKFIETLKPFKVEHKITPEYPSGHAYQKMIASIEGQIRPIVSQMALRSMQKAKYHVDCIGHFGLGAKFYCHFTSPIRRYPDLVVHRIIKMYLNRQLPSHALDELREFVPKAADQSSKTEITATEVEREVNNLKRAEYMSDHIGEKFSGTISGIMDFGVFVYLPNTVEGLIKIDNMPQDSYRYNESQSVLVGRKRSFKMGDQIDVVCVGVNMARRQVEFAAWTR